MIPDSLTPEQLERALNLADLSKTQRELILRVCNEDESLQAAAAHLGLEMDEAEALYDQAYASCQEALVGSQLEFYRELLQWMRGHRRHDPRSPKIIVDRYNSAPGKPAFKTVSASPGFNEWDFVPAPRDHPEAMVERRRVARVDPSHPNAGKKRRGR